MNADRLAEIRERLEIAAHVAASVSPGHWGALYASDVGDLLAALDEQSGVVGATWASPTISIMESLESLKMSATGLVGCAPIDELARRNVLASMAYAESLLCGRWEELL